MRDIKNYISGLLFIHDCVILPGFGGFITNDKSAVHDTSNHTFHPPKKDILFNRNLTYNDGLLINYLAKNMGIPYDEAKQKVQETVDRAWLALDKNQEVVFEGVGSFKNDVDGKLIFTPAETINYQVDSYGLSSFRFPPLDYEKNARDIIPLYNATIMNEGVKKTLKWVGIIVLPIIGAIALVPYSKSKLNPQSAGLFRLQKTNNDQPIEMVHSAMPVDTMKPDIIDQSTDKRNALFYSEEVNTANAVKKQKTEGLTFYIIGGSYRESYNAEKHAAAYQKKGFEQATVIHVDELYRVSLSHFDNKVNALHELRRIRKMESNDKVWLFSKK